MTAEEEMQQSMEALEMAKMRLDNLSKQAEMLQMSLNEHARAVETLKAVRGAKEGTEIMMPVGAGAFIPARTTGAKWAIVGIGAGVALEKSYEDAVATLEKDSAEIELQERKLVQEIKNIEKQAAFLNQRIQQLSQGSPSQEQGESCNCGQHDQSQEKCDCGHDHKSDNGHPEKCDCAHAEDRHGHEHKEERASSSPPAPHAEESAKKRSSRKKKSDKGD